MRKPRLSRSIDQQAGISKRGDPYLRTLLIHGARAVEFDRSWSRTQRPALA